MRKFIFIGLLLTGFLHAGLFDKDIQIKHNQTSAERKYPTHQDYLLSYNNILEKVRTSVVNISTKKSVKMGNDFYANPFFNDPLFKEFFKGFGDPNLNIPKERIQESLGSGVIISVDGYIVTNNHVIEGADEIKVSIPGTNKDFNAKIIGTDSKTDLAVIKIDANNLNAITFYNSIDVKIGDVVFALGNPFGLGETITQGIISAKGRATVGIVEYENFIQTDASINPGNSGGALINSAGYLIGINSAIISRSGGNVGIGFAIPSNMVENISKVLINKGEFARAYLGVVISDISDDLSTFYGKKFGALVTSVEKDSSADKIGLKRGDLIVAVNDEEIHSASSLKNLIGTMAPNTKIRIKYLRNKKVFTKEVVLGNLKNKKISITGYEYMGMHLEPLSIELKKKAGIPSNISGVYVSSVDTNSPAFAIGILEGDVVVQVEDQEIDSIDGFKEAVQKFGKKRFYLYRRGVFIVFVM